jgi:hypothetical protein
MKKTFVVAAAGLVLLVAVIAMPQREPLREISLSDLRDKIEGGWAGQMIGVSYGAPTECRHDVCEGSR